MPNTPSMINTSVARPAFDFGMINAVNARMPPSPWLSAFITSAMYLTEMITTSAQNANDATPIALVRDTSRCWCSSASRNA